MDERHGDRPVDLPPRSWFACDAPERPFDDDVVIEMECRACAVAFGAHARQWPSSLWFDFIDPSDEMSAVIFYERLRQNHANLPPLPVDECRSS